MKILPPNNINCKYNNFEKINNTSILQLIVIKIKIVFTSLYLGLKKGYDTPTLPENILNMEKRWSIIIMKLLGSISMILICANSYYHFNFNLYIILILLIFVLVYGIYNFIISYFRIKHIIYILKSDQLNIIIKSDKKSSDIN